MIARVDTGGRREGLWTCSALLLAAPVFPITLVASGNRKVRQPGFAADGPEFIGRCQLIRGIERTQMQFHFITGLGKDRRAAARAERSPLIRPCLAFNRHGILRKHSRGVEQSPVMLAAVETMAKADPIRFALCHKPDLSAQAASGVSLHDLVFLQPSRCRASLFGHVDTGSGRG